MPNSKLNKDLYLIMATSCKLITGKYRSVIIDYDRDAIYYIKNEFAIVLNNFNRQTIRLIEQSMDDEESLENLHQFIDFLIDKEIIYLTSTPENFPERTTEIKKTPSILDNLIIEIDGKFWNPELEERVIESISQCFVSDIQLRLFSFVEYDFISNLLKKIEEAGVKYIELVCSLKHIPSIDSIKLLLTETPLLSAVYIFETEMSLHENVSNNSEAETITYGDLYLIKGEYAPNETCGIINLHSLDFSGIDAFNLLHIKNGCLYKKASIDTMGNIRNCPSLPQIWGNIYNNELLEIVAKDEFRQMWDIHKDLIEGCKDCELRYCCSDCRAHVNLYAKPKQCMYNIDKGKWM